MQSTPTKRTRRYHPPDLKRQVVAASQQPGASVAAVALAHGLNANLVRRWMRETPPGGGALTVGLYVVVGLVFPPVLQPGVFAAFAAAWVLPTLFGPALAAWMRKSWKQPVDSEIGGD